MKNHWLEKFRPDISVGTLADIDLQHLKSIGYTSILVDMDNTLLPWKGDDVPESTKDWVKHAQEMGFELCIVSNTHNPKRLKTVGEQLGLKTVRQAIKPRRRGFHRAMNMLGSQAHECVVVGDQMLTDILGGRRSGMLTVLVDPMHRHEFFGTKLSRLVERLINSALSRRRDHGNNG